MKPAIIFLLSLLLFSATPRLELGIDEMTFHNSFYVLESIIQQQYSSVQINDFNLDYEPVKLSLSNAFANVDLELYFSDLEFSPSN
jgi:hypothetical protein